MKKGSRRSKKKSDGTYAIIPKKTPRWRRRLRTITRRRRPSAPPMPAEMLAMPSAPPMPAEMLAMPSAPPMLMPSAPPMPRLYRAPQIRPPSILELAVASPPAAPPPLPPPRRWRALDNIRSVIQDVSRRQMLDAQLNRDGNEELPNDWRRIQGVNGRVVYVQDVAPFQRLFHPPPSQRRARPYSGAHGKKRKSKAKKAKRAKKASKTKKN